MSKMGKMKTRKSVAKRFSATGTGKLKFKKRGLRHILEKKSANAKRSMRQPCYVHESDIGRVKRCLPYL